MKNSKNGLDEMQREKRNTIGNQMFMLIFYALLIDCGLYGAGIRWLAYPSNVMVIMMACMGIYLVRTIAANAYLPANAQTQRKPGLIVAVVVLSVVLAAAAFFLFRTLSVQPAGEDKGDNSALILFIVSATGLLISAIAAIIKKCRDRNDGEE